MPRAKFKPSVSLPSVMRRGAGPDPPDGDAGLPLHAVNSTAAATAAPRPAVRLQRKFCVMSSSRRRCDAPFACGDLKQREGIVTDYGTTTIGARQKVALVAPGRRTLTWQS